MSPNCRKSRKIKVRNRNNNSKFSTTKRKKFNYGLKEMVQGPGVDLPPPPLMAP